MKILLLSFPGKDLIGPPLGIAYVASMLNNHGHNAVISEGNNKTVKDQINAAKRIKPDIVGISIDTSSRINCLKIAKEIKKELKIPIILGGPHATIMYDQLLKNYSFIDYIIRGEGEYSCLNLLNSIEQNKPLDKINGLSFRKDRKVVHNPKSELIKNLDELPFPEYKFFNLEGYTILPQYPKGTKKVGHIHTSRGCPHKCTFCSTHSLYGDNVRFRSAKSVIDEMETLYKKYDIKYIAFLDDHFTANRERVIEICKIILERNLHKVIKWQCNSEVNVINEEILS